MSELDYSKEELQGYRETAAGYATSEAKRYTLSPEKIAETKREYASLIGEGKRTEAKRLLDDFKSQQREAWVAETTAKYLRGKGWPGSEYLAYYWLKAERSGLEATIKFSEDQKRREGAKEQQRAIDACTQHIERISPLGTGGLNAITASLEGGAIGNLIQDIVNTADSVGASVKSALGR